MKLLYFSIIILFFTSCTSSDSKKIPSLENNISAHKRDSFFPVTSFLKGQINQFDSLPSTPLHTITVNGKTDSVWIKREQLAILLESFLSPTINETNLVAYFKETSFNDLTLNTLTLTYDAIQTLPDSLHLTHWDVYINPETGKIRKIYMVKQLKINDDFVTEQLTWQTNKSATITTLINKGGNKTELLKVDKFIWNFSE